MAACLIGGDSHAQGPHPISSACLSGVMGDGPSPMDAKRQPLVASFVTTERGLGLLAPTLPEVGCSSATGAR